MKPNPPIPGETGPRRPQPLPTIRRYSSATTQIIKLSSFKSRLRLVNYELPLDFLPNGLPRPSYVIGEGTLQVGSDFYLRARLVQPYGEGQRLEVEAKAYDLVTRSEVAFPLSDSLFRDIHDEISRAHVLARARRLSRGAGRN